MKASLALGNPTPDRQTAWGCLLTNVALPGFGSLAGGRRIGYWQALLCLLGLALTFIFGIRFAMWYFSQWREINSGGHDPSEMLLELWRAVRWALFGIAVFGVSWLWALMTSLSIVLRAPAAAPPTLHG